MSGGLETSGTMAGFAPLRAGRETTRRPIRVASGRDRWRPSSAEVISETNQASRNKPRRYVSSYEFARGQSPRQEGTGRTNPPTRARHESGSFDSSLAEHLGENAAGLFPQIVVHIARGVVPQRLHCYLFCFIQRNRPDDPF